MPPAYLRCDLSTFPLASLGCKFDVILVGAPPPQMRPGQRTTQSKTHPTPRPHTPRRSRACPALPASDPPWDEYARRAGAHGVSGVASWSGEQIAALRVEDVADTPCFLFLCCGSAEGLSHGRTCLARWGFRRVEDICWLKTNKRASAAAGGGGGGLAGGGEDSVLVPTVEHVLVGIRGSVRRSADGHILHANCDTDVVVSEEPPFGSSAKARAAARRRMRPPPGAAGRVLIGSGWF